MAPVKCSECTHYWAAARVCSLMPFTRIDGKGTRQCLYHEGRKPTTKAGKSEKKRI